MTSERRSDGADLDAGAVERAEQLAAAIAERLAGRTVAAAESVTAGRISSALAGVVGASDWFRGGLVAYQTGIKRRLLDVTSTSVLCEAAVAEMAEGVRRLLDSEVAVASSGVAGDEPVDGVAPGTVCIATTVDGRVRTRTVQLGAIGGELADAGTVAALAQLLDHLGEA